MDILTNSVHKPVSNSQNTPSSLWKQALYIVCTLCAPLFAISQNLPAVDAITIEDGLGFRSVRALAQDQQGLMWLGTRQGLNRFDGYNFTYYNKGPLGDYPLPAEDFREEGMIIRDSLICYIANRRLFSLNIQTHQVRPIKVSVSTDSSNTLDLLQIHQGKKGKLWLVAEDTAQQFLLELKENYEIRRVAQNRRSTQEFTHIATDTSGNVYWSTISKGIQRYSPEGSLLQEVKADAFIWYEQEMYFTPFFIDNQNRLFLFPKSSNEIWNYDIVTREKVILQKSLDSPVYVSLEDHRGHLWFATKKRLLEMDKAGNWIDYSAQINKPFDFTTINCLFEDQMQLLWIGTDNGVLKLPIKKQAFTNFLHIPGVEWGNTTRGFFENNQGEVFVMCERGEEGLHQVDWDQGKTVPKFTKTSTATENFPLAFTNFFVYDEKRKGIWSAHKELTFLQDTFNRLITIPTRQGLTAGFSPNPILLQEDGRLIVGQSLQQLCFFDPDTDTYENIIPADSPLSTSEQIRFLFEAGDTLWVGTKSEGLLQINKKGDLHAQYTISSSPAISHNHILCIVRDDDGILWIGTFGGGVNRIDLKQQTIEIYTQKDNLANNNVVGILPYDKNYLWISTYNGISCFYKPTGTFQNFYQEDGLSHNEFNFSSFFKDSQGRYYFGGMNGVTAFKPQAIIGQAPNPPLQLTTWSQFSQKEKNLKQEDLRYFDGNPLVINPNVSYFQINWTLPNYFKPDKNQYYTLLEGLEDDWTYIGNQPSMRYNKLPVGDYTLHIKGADSRGNWSSSQLSIPLQIKPYFFNTWWFLAICMLFSSLIVYSIFQYRWQQLLKMERLRLKISSNLHDEVGSMLSGLAMQAEIIEMRAKPENQAGLRSLSEISRQAVSKMRDLVWSIDTRRDKVKDLLERMQEHAEEMLIPKEISFQFKVGYLPLEKKLPIDTRQHLQLIFREAITNIVKHSDASQVWVSLDSTEKGFTMIVKDNGQPAKGKPAKGGSGLGIDNMKMRANKLGGKLEILSEEKGFQVILTTKSL